MRAGSIASSFSVFKGGLGGLVAGAFADMLDFERLLATTGDAAFASGDLVNARGLLDCATAAAAGELIAICSYWRQNNKLTLRKAFCSGCARVTAKSALLSIAGAALCPLVRSCNGCPFCQIASMPTLNLFLVPCCIVQPCLPCFGYVCAALRLRSTRIQNLAWTECRAQ